MRNKEKSTEFGTKKVRKKYNGNLIMLFALIVVAILLVFAWYVMNSIPRIRGVQLVSRDTIDVSYVTYKGVGHSSKVFDESQNISAEGVTPQNVSLFPGERQYYKTVLCNYESQAFTGDFCITDSIVNKQLESSLSESGTISSYINFLAYRESDSSEVQNHPLQPSTGNVGSTTATVGMQPIFEGVTLPAGTDNNSDGEIDVPGMTVVIWCVELNGDTVTNFTGGDPEDSDTTVMGDTLITFHSIYFERQS